MYCKWISSFNTLCIKLEGMNTSSWIMFDAPRSGRLGTQGPHVHLAVSADPCYRFEYQWLWGHVFLFAQRTYYNGRCSYLLVCGPGPAPKRCKINFQKSLFNSTLYERLTDYKVKSVYQAQNEMFKNSIECITGASDTFTYSQHICLQRPDSYSILKSPEETEQFQVKF